MIIIRGGTRLGIRCACVCIYSGFGYQQDEESITAAAVERQKKNVNNYVEE